MAKTIHSMDKNLSDLCALLRLALDFKSDVSSTSFNSKTDWDGIISLAAAQGVLALGFEGVMKLPLEKQPSRKMKINWGVNVEILKEKIKHHNSVIDELASIFSQHKIDMMLLKGRGLAFTYPNPLLREESDIDIYLLGKFEKGNELIRQQGLDLYSGEYTKHSKFFYKGLSIENHYHFLDSHSPAEELIEKYLLDCITNNTPFSTLNGSANTYLPPPDFNAVFIIKHALNHLWRTETALRHLCDWACFLRKYENLIDFDNYRNVMNNAGLLHLADAFTALTVDCLGVDAKYAPPFKRNKKLEKLLMNKIVKSPLFFPGQSLWGKLIYEYKRIKEEQDVYTLFFSKNIWFRAKKKLYRYI